MTFDELRTEAQKIYKEVCTADGARNREHARLLATYTPTVAAEQYTHVVDNFRAYVDKCAGKFESMVTALLAEKREGIDKMLATAPTAEQLNLLTSIQLRGESVSENELIHVVAQLAPNYQAVNALRAIAEANHKRIHLTGKYDFETLNAEFEWVERYLSERVHDLRSFTGHCPGQVGNLFFGEGWRDSNYDEHTANLPD